MFPQPISPGRESFVPALDSNRFRLQNQLLFERISVTAEVTVCVHGLGRYDCPKSPAVSSVRSATRGGFRIEGVRR
jgi:hypothetical protein